MEKGYMVFTVTTANGSVPIENAKISLKTDDIIKESTTKSDGRSYAIELEFDPDAQPHINAAVKISADGYISQRLENVIIYKNVTTVRIINLERI